MESGKVAGLRQDYSDISLQLSEVHSDAIAQFAIWFNEALYAGVEEPNAMTLSTASKEGKPSARIVLLKDFDAAGFTFFTNYNSRKGAEIEENPFGALTFWWQKLARQVRIEGEIEKISEELSEEYFKSRPKNSQIGAWASMQSEVIEERTALEEKFHNLAEEYEKAENLPKPPFWGGYLLKPVTIEFWQGRANRLHDRIRYSLVESNWKTERLSP